MTPERMLLIIGAGLGVLTGLGALVRTTWRELRKVSRTMDDFAGAPARNGKERTKGVLERLEDQDERLDRVFELVETMAHRQVEIGQVAQLAAEDVQKVVHELTPNSGTSTKDQVAKALSAAERAAETAALTQGLLRRHMANGREIMEVGIENDRRVGEAFAALGVAVDYHPFPDVDTGEDDFPTAGV
jgi:hypothetical protein